MKLTKRQLKDLETIKFFIPEAWKDIPITNEDIKDFFALSEKGIKKERPAFFKSKSEITGYDCLLEGKRWRGIHIHEIYEPGILDGDVPYFVLLGGYCGKKRNWFLRLLGKEPWEHDPLPRSVVDFLKREMFKGHDADIIEDVYLELQNK